MDHAPSPSGVASSTSSTTGEPPLTQRVGVLQQRVSCSSLITAKAYICGKISLFLDGSSILFLINIQTRVVIGLYSIHIICNANQLECLILQLIITASLFCDINKKKLCVKREKNVTDSMLLVLLKLIVGTAGRLPARVRQRGPRHQEPIGGRSWPEAGGDRARRGASREAAIRQGKLTCSHNAHCSLVFLSICLLKRAINDVHSFTYKRKSIFII